ncbi:hypothetical protein [Shewanella sp. GXUN23E]|uniref:hypothetical protein n=1 Tax=Shewanella sp. GXUN23E TaxID=3422498 RepID=UPI003D7D6039
MLITILGWLWLLLMLWAAYSEYRYYQAVKALEPGLWHDLGVHGRWQFPLMFISPKGARMLQQCTNPHIRVLAQRHRRANQLFVTYIGGVLLVAIGYFYLA